MIESQARDLLRRLPSIPGPAWPLDIETAPTTPQALFWHWLQFAVDSGVPEPHAMTLSTVGLDGQPDARVLILKDLDARGWHFATDADSPKGHQIAAHPAVALTLYWPRFARQVRIRGQAASLGPDAGRADFLARSKQAKAVALLGRQSDPLSALTELDTALAETSERLNASPDTPAPGWSVFVVAPQTVEFWQGDRDRRHLRLNYQKNGSSWHKEMLWP